MNKLYILFPHEPYYINIHFVGGNDMYYTFAITLILLGIFLLAFFFAINDATLLTCLPLIKRRSIQHERLLHSKVACTLIRCLKGFEVTFILLLAVITFVIGETSFYNFIFPLFCIGALSLIIIDLFLPLIIDSFLIHSN